jgi:hypothetical protein
MSHLLLSLLIILILAAGRPSEARQALETARALFAEIGLAGGVEWVEGIMQQLNLS